MRTCRRFGGETEDRITSAAECIARCLLCQTAAMAEQGEKVQLYVYDLSQGLARQLSLALLGKQIDGVWHTSVVVGGREFYFGGGIQEAPAGRSPFGQPLQTVDLGETFVPEEVRREYIDDLRPKFSEVTYNLFTNNCNNFSDELAQFLTGTGIPGHITALPREVLATPFGQMLAPMLSQTIGDRLGHVHQSDAQQGPASGPQAANEVSHIAADIKNVAAVAAADTGIPVEAGPHGAEAAQAAAAAPAQEGVQELSKAHASLSSHPETAASIAQAPSNSAELPALANGSTPPPAKTTPKSQPLTSLPDSNSKAAPLQSQPGQSRAAFEEAVKAEFTRIMASGSVTANEAAALAVRRVAGLQPA